MSARGCITAVMALLLVACQRSGDTPRAQGLTTYDRADLVAEQAEPVLVRLVHKGQNVHAGDILLTLDSRRGEARLQTLDAEIWQAQATLDERIRGPRVETIAAARAELARAQAEARIAVIDEKRVARLVRVKATGEADLDTAHARTDAAAARVRQVRAQLEELLAGTRAERITAARAALAALKARRRAAAVDLQRLTIRTPVDGVVDELPFEIGETPRVGDTVVVLFTGKPWVRTYVAEGLRAGISSGQQVMVRVDGMEREIPGRVRHIRRDADFTPFFALNQRDRGRLSYEAEVVLDTDHAIAAGLPATVLFPAQ